MSFGNSRILATLCAAAFIVAASSCGGGGRSVSLGPNSSILPLKITTIQLRAGKVGLPYLDSVAAQGGAGPLTWRVATGSLPPGITLDSRSGVLTGTPSSSGEFGVTIEVADSSYLGPKRALASFVLDVTMPSLTITTTALPPGAVAQPYSFTLQATGGTLPYFWSLTAGSLPSGLHLDSLTGKITGTPTSQQTTYFTVQVTDSSSPQSVATITLGRAPRASGG